MAINGNVNGAQQPSSAGNLLSALATPDNVAGMRMAVPILKSVEDLKGIKDAYAASNAVRYAYNGVKGGLSGASGGAAGIGGAASGAAGIGGAASAAGRSVFFGALSNALRCLPSLLKSNFLIAGLMSIFTNGLDFASGRENGTQFLVDTACDTAAYTGIGATATMIGGMVGSIVPGIGTIIGMGVGALVGFLGSKLYETYLRPSFTSMMQAKVAGLGSHSTSSYPPPSTLPSTIPSPGSLATPPALAPAA